MKTIAALLIILVVGAGGYLLWRANAGTGTSETATTTDTELTQIRPADAQSPAAGTCVFQDGEMVNFDINSDIPSPRCVFALTDQKLGFTNKSSSTINFSFASATFSIEPGETERVEEGVGTYLAPGVHRVAMPNYNGSGPEVWVMDPSVTRIEGEVTDVFVSAKGIVVKTTGGQALNLGLDNETRIANASSTPIAIANFSTALKKGTKVVAIVDLETLDTGLALTIRIVP